MTEFQKWLQDVYEAAKEVMAELTKIEYKEAVYEEALSHEMRIRGIPYERQRNFEILYKGYNIGVGRVDFIINPFWATKGEENVLEIKATKTINNSHVRQAKVYMNSLSIRSGAVMSFHPETGPQISEIKLAELKPQKYSVEMPKKKEEIRIQELLPFAIKEIHDYLGTEFIFRESTSLDSYINAMAVELRLNGIDFQTSSFPITYKCQKVSEINIDFVFRENNALTLELYKKAEEIEDRKNYYRYYKERLGIDKLYIGLIPQKEDMETIICEI